MATTSSSGLRYPIGSAVPNVPQDIQNLATDLDRKVVPPFTTAAARSAAIPSPIDGQPCTVAGVLQVYRAGSWRFRLAGEFVAVVSDANAFYSFAHGGGQTPYAWGVSALAQATDQINTIISVLGHSKSSSTLVARFMRSDTNSYLATNTVSFSWWAEF